MSHEHLLGVHITISDSVQITISKENYLKAIAEAESEGETVIAATLARWLEVSAPAVTMAIRRLKRDGLIRVAASGELSLTREGREIANRVLNRHHLIERMLTEIFGMEWYKVHDEAEQLEHAVSADFESKLLDKLGTRRGVPAREPVGMDRPRDRRERGWIPLDEAGGDSAVTRDERVRARSQAARVPERAGHSPRRAVESGREELRPDHDAACGSQTGAARRRGGREGVGRG